VADEHKFVVVLCLTRSHFSGRNRPIRTYPPLFGAPVWGDLTGIFHIDFGIGKLESLRNGVVCVILGLAIFVQLRLVTDRRADVQTDGHIHDGS